MLYWKTQSGKQYKQKKNMLFDTLLLVEMRNIGNQLNQDGAVAIKEWKQPKIIMRA